MKASPLLLLSALSLAASCTDPPAPKPAAKAATPTAAKTAAPEPTAAPTEPVPMQEVAPGVEIPKKRADGIPYLTPWDFALVMLDPADLEPRLNAIPGVLECGLFVGLAGRIVVGRDDGTVDVLE